VDSAAASATIADLIHSGADTLTRKPSAQRVAPILRRNLCVVLLWCLLCVAAGCGRGAPHGPSLNVALAHRYQHFAAQFEHRTGLHLRLVAQSYVDILHALHAEAGGGRGMLDLVELDLSMLGEARPQVRALDDLVTPAQRKLFPQAAWQTATADNRLFFIPHRLMWQAMIYNRVEVPKPPATWDELSAFVRDHPGKFALKGALYEGAVCDVMSFVWAAGGSERDPESPGSIAALNFLDSLAPGLNPQSAVFREMSVLEAQARGQVWLHFNWPFAMSYLAAKGLAPQIELSAPIPAGPHGTFSVLGGGYLAIPRSAPHPQAAREFLRYLLTTSAQTRLSRELGWYGSIAPPPGSEEARLYDGFSAMRDHVRARPPIAAYSALSNRWQRIIHEVLFDAVQPAAAVAQQR
jgi:ABC-type glycerol-3-phosphate transport system substrate-binding protein